MCNFLHIFEISFYYMLNQQMRDVFFHSFYFLVFWLLVCENLYGLIWAFYPSDKMKKTTEKKPFECSWWLGQNSSGC